MKRSLIIGGFFVLMICLSFFVVKATAYIKMNKKEISFVKRSHQLTDLEILNEKITRNPDKKYIRYYETTETRTKKFFGWNTKIDTTKVSVMEEDDK